MKKEDIQFIVNGKDKSFIPHIKLGSKDVYQDRHTMFRKGIYLDVVRRTYTLDALKEVIDIISDTKQAEFFLHFSDNEGFRIKIDYFPQHEGFYYTKDEIKELVRYANSKHIRVIPVFDSPAHSKGWLDLLKVNYPDIYPTVVSDFTDDMVNYWANTETSTIVKNILDELFPLFRQPHFGDKQFFHLGMDEVSGASSNQSWLFWYIEYLINHTINNGFEVILWNDGVHTEFLDMVANVGLQDKISYTYWQQSSDLSATPDELMSYSPVYNCNFWTQTFHAHNLNAENSVPYMKSNAKRNGFKTEAGTSVESLMTDNAHGGLITIWGHNAQTRDENEILTELKKIFEAFKSI